MRVSIYRFGNRHGVETRMANVIPEEIGAVARSGDAAREIETLMALAQQLSSEFTVYHGVHWARAEGRRTVYGEIDFIVVDRLGRALAIEQKNGAIGLGEHDLIKRYPTGAKGVKTQVVRNVNEIRRRFAKQFPGNLHLDHLLYLPDARLA